MYGRVAPRDYANNCSGALRREQPVCTRNPADSFNPWPTHVARFHPCCRISKKRSRRRIMNAYTGGKRRAKQRMGTAKRGILVAASLTLLGACTHLMMMGSDVEPPPASDFGYGPRASVGGLYQASIEPTEPLRTRRMHTVKLS